jgi:hypothetical protein
MSTTNAAPKKPLASHHYYRGPDDCPEDWTVGQFGCWQLSVGQALLPVRVCGVEVEPDRQECLSYPIPKFEACLVDLTLSRRYPKLRLPKAWRPRTCEADLIERQL